MSYVESLAFGERKARKQHQCFDCYRTIPKGDVYDFQTLKYDGIYTICQHKDCADASEFYCEFHGISPWDFDNDGVPPLADMIADSGEFDSDMGLLRGHFPHVVCRLELNMQLARLRREDTQ